MVIGIAWVWNLIHHACFYFFKHTVPIKTQNQKLCLYSTFKVLVNLFFGGGNGCSLNIHTNKKVGTVAKHTQKHVQWRGQSTT